MKLYPLTTLKRPVRNALLAAGVLCFAVLILVGIHLAQEYNLFPKRPHYAPEFGITVLQSEYDADGDGIDDFTDLMQGARAYVQTKPRYKSEYYEGGYPPEGIGVCTDVIWHAFANAGYDLKAMVDADIKLRPEAYDKIDKPDENIDFRRVYNLAVFFEAYAESLTCDETDIAAWQPGDIVIYPHHIAMVSDKRNANGVAYIIHHGGQPVREEDAITRHEIIGHYRFSDPDRAKEAGILLGS